jgi:hypothetical protein
MSLTQKLALTWLTTFDKSLFLFTSLKGLNTIFRYAFYISLVLALCFVILKFEAIIDIRAYNIPIFIQNLLIVLGLGVKFLTIIFTIGIFSYESIYNLDINKYLVEQKQKEEFIKKNKLQKWRLKNMNILLRVIIYLGIWCFLYLLLEDILISSFFTVYGNTPSKEIFLQFLIDYDLAIKYFTVIYLVSIGILDYFVRRNRRARIIKKFPQETLGEKNE